MKFAVALGRSPGHGPDKARRAYNFLPKHTTEYDLKAIEKKIMHKLEDRCEVTGRTKPCLCSPAVYCLSGSVVVIPQRRLQKVVGASSGIAVRDLRFRVCDSSVSL